MIKELDEITLRLLIQTSTRTFGQMSTEEIHKQFIEQEKKKEWKLYKSRVIKTVVDRYGIEYGKGKYVTATEEDLANIDKEKE